MKIKNGHNPIIPSVVYDWMEGEGMISFTKDEKHEFLRQAKTEYGRELQLGIINGSAKPADKFLLEKLHEKDFYKHRELMVTLQVRAKVIAVKKYLNE